MVDVNYIKPNWSQNYLLGYSASLVAKKADLGGRLQVESKTYSGQ